VHHSVDEALYVVSGRLVLQLGDEHAEASPGGFVWMPRGAAHAFANAGPAPVKVLALALPAGIEELFAEHAAYLATLSGPPDARVMEEIGARHDTPTVGPPIRAEGAPAGA
jgi:oxalate decarboxylase/phosphoglucose isomerase-like protein (cupin superfamily)